MRALVRVLEPLASGPVVADEAHATSRTGGVVTGVHRRFNRSGIQVGFASVMVGRASRLLRTSLGSTSVRRWMAGDLEVFRRMAVALSRHPSALCVVDEDWNLMQHGEER